MNKKIHLDKLQKFISNEPSKWEENFKKMKTKKYKIRSKKTGNVISQGHTFEEAVSEKARLEKLNGRFVADRENGFEIYPNPD